MQLLLGLAETIVMRGFGVWLWEGGDKSVQAERLMKAALDLRASWPMASDRRADYENAIKSAKTETERAELLEAVRGLWPAYLTASGGASDGTWAAVGRQIVGSLSNIGPWGIAIGGVLLITLFIRSFDPTFLATISKIEAARGLITFLFAIGTVGIAVIIVLAVFLSTENKEEAAARFQRGKDVLTILIGVFGAILGFYFGSETSSVDEPVPLPPVAAAPADADAGMQAEADDGAQEDSDDGTQEDVNGGAQEDTGAQTAIDSNTQEDIDEGTQADAPPTGQAVAPAGDQR